jgi:hypothetical protein
LLRAGIAGAGEKAIVDDVKNINSQYKHKYQFYSKNTKNSKKY